MRMSVFVVLVLAAVTGEFNSQARQWGELFFNGSATSKVYVLKRVPPPTKKLHLVEFFEKFPDRSKEPLRNISRSELAGCDGTAGRPLHLEVDGVVYDVTDFVDLHPGGPLQLRQRGGLPAGDAMRASGMPAEVFEHLHRFQVGVLVEDPPSLSTTTTAAESSTNPASSDQDILCSLDGICF